MEEDTVKLTPYQIQSLIRGELIYVEHPEKGLCYSNPQDVYVGITELTENLKK